MDSNEMRTESTSETVLKTDDLSHLKRGTILVDSNGKRYRIEKSVVPQSLSGGPANIGNPDDRSLRKIEAIGLIPERMNKQIEKHECRESYLRYMKCMNEGNRWNQFSRCIPASDAFNDCKMKMFNDLDFRQKVTLEYLEERRQFRLSGKNGRQREWERYNDWKRGQQKSDEMQNY